MSEKVFTQDDLDAAYDDGVRDGEAEGFDSGYAEGYDIGYADGVEEGEG